MGDLVADAITVTLAHPLTAAMAADLQIADVRDYAAGEQVVVPRDQIRRLINSGRVAGIAPGDEEAIRELLGRPATAPLIARPIAALWDMTYPGPAVAHAGTLRWYNDTGRPVRIERVRASVATPPIGGALRVDVLRDGTTSLFDGEQARPTVAADQYSGAAAPAAGMAELAPGQFLTVNIDTVGGDSPGADLAVTVTASDAGTGSIPGPAGHTPCVYSGAEPPVALHDDGDLYLQAGGNLYQQQAGAWVLVGNLQGPAGPSGSAVTINGYTGETINLTAADVGAVPASAVLEADPGVPAWRHSRAWPVVTDDANIAEFSVQGVLTAWLNEAGLYRARTHPGAPWDSQFRAFLGAGQTGNPFEVVSQDGQTVVWGVRPDGAIVRNGAPTASVMLLALDDPVPDDTPPGTIIVRS